MPIQSQRVKKIFKGETNFQNTLNSAINLFLPKQENNINNKIKRGDMHFEIETSKAELLVNKKKKSYFQ